MIVILDCPVNRVARQSVLAVERGEVPIFQAAQSFLGGSPENAVTVESQAADLALAQPVRDTIRFADCPACEIVDASVIKAKPHSALCQVSRNGRRKVLM